MPIRKLQLVNDEIYHIVLRGVGDSLIFKDINDYYREVFSLYEFNNVNPVHIWQRRKERKKEKSVQCPTLHARELMVEILAFCFMPNHIHLLLKQIRDKGITEFMRKVGTGYAVYFNKKYDRKGHLFQGFKAIHIKDNAQLQNVFVYIHANPISLIEPKWKEIGIKEPDEVIKFLEEDYRWSSYFDYIGKKNFLSVTERKFLLKIMGGVDGCKENMENWIKHKGEIKAFSDISLE